ncbi:MAG: leucyl aminopeptidase, partial [Aquabacterium sp.]|nr:leucyl aminopeptidase [Aquabacterium sp.]
MDFELKTLNSKGPQGGRADAVIMPVPEGWQAGGDAVSGLAAQAHGHGDLPTKPGKVLQMYRPEGPGPRRMVFVGAGQGTAREVRQAVAAALSAIKSPDMRVLALHLGGLKDVGEAVVRATMLAVSDVSYTYTATKSRPQPRALRAVEIWVPDPTALRNGVARAAALVGGMELAREWANRPGNHATPRMLAKAAKDLAGSNGISCEVLDEKAIRRLGMGSFLAVAQGSAQPPRFIILKYK